MTLAAARKAVAPALLAIAAVIGQWIATGGLDASELRTAIAGLFTAVVVYLIPNEPAVLAKAPGPGGTV